MSLVIGSFCYCFFVASFILPAYRSEMPNSDLFLLNRTFIQVFVLFGASVNGFGASILWVA